jgi:hypothetical protein
MIPIVLTRPAWAQPAVSPACPSEDHRGFFLRDLKRGNPESNGTNERHSFEYAQLLTQYKDLEAEVVAGTKECAEAGEEANEKWNHALGFMA